LTSGECTFVVARSHFTDCKIEIKRWERGNGEQGEKKECSADSQWQSGRESRVLACNCAATSSRLPHRGPCDSRKGRCEAVCGGRKQSGCADYRRRGRYPERGDSRLDGSL